MVAWRGLIPTADLPDLLQVNLGWTWVYAYLEREWSVEPIADRYDWLPAYDAAPGPRRGVPCGADPGLGRRS